MINIIRVIFKRTFIKLKSFLSLVKEVSLTPMFIYTKILVDIIIITVSYALNFKLLFIGWAIGFIFFIVFWLFHLFRFSQIKIKKWYNQIKKEALQLDKQKSFLKKNNSGNLSLTEYESGQLSINK